MRLGRRHSAKYCIALSSKGSKPIRRKFAPLLLPRRFAFVSVPRFGSLGSRLNPYPSILTNMAFRDSPVWCQSSASVCRTGESPDLLGVLTQTFRLLRQRPNFDVVLTMGPRPSLAYGLACGLLGVPSKQVLTEIFLDPPRPASIPWRLKTMLFRRISRRALGILANSSQEVDLIASRFGVPKSKVRFVPMHATPVAPPPVQSGKHGVVSIGRTARDLDTLALAAQTIDSPVHVVVGRDDPLPPILPPNLSVSREIPLADAHALLARASVAVVSLKPSERSAGQVVMFEAMSLGIPVVATRTVGTVDYVRDGHNGLLVEPGDAQSLSRAVNRILRDPALGHALAVNALRDCQTLWSPDRHALNKLAAIRDLAAPPSSNG